MKLVLTVLAMLLLATAAAAQCVSLTTIYNQDFNTLATTGLSNTVLPVGWFFYETGTNANVYYRTDSGSGATGDTYSYGSGPSTDRALGTLLSGSLNPTIGACFTNNTGLTLTALGVGYTGEQWRQGATGRRDRLDFQYSLNATSLSTGTWIDQDELDFLAPNYGSASGPYDGNAEANRTLVQGTITGVTLAPGATVWIRWADFNATSSDDGLAVDDFMLVPEGPGVPALPATWGRLKALYR